VDTWSVPPGRPSFMAVRSSSEAIGYETLSTTPKAEVRQLISRAPALV
jgi:hypothetical protein